MAKVKTGRNNEKQQLRKYFQQFEEVDGMYLDEYEYSEYLDRLNEEYEALELAYALYLEREEERKREEEEEKRWQDDDYYDNF